MKRLYCERKDFCEDFISMVSKLCFLSYKYTYVSGYQATHFVGLFAA